MGYQFATRCPAISKFKATCLAVLQEVRQTGQPILVTRRGEPIAEVELNTSPHAWVEHQLDSVPMRDAPLTREVATMSRMLNLTHEDPADRFIAATAVVYDLTLVTADERLCASKHYQVLQNR